MIASLLQQSSVPFLLSILNFSWFLRYSHLCLPCPEEMLTSLGSQNVTFEALSACNIGLGKKYKDLEENLVLGTATFFYNKHSFPTLGSNCKERQHEQLD